MQMAWNLPSVMTLADHVDEDFPPLDTPTFTFSHIQTTVSPLPSNYVTRLLARVIALSSSESDVC
jgi:hypothetical protein